MILGLPWQSWLLLVVAVGAGLLIELAFLRNQRRRRRKETRTADHPDPGSGPPSPPS